MALYSRFFDTLVPVSSTEAAELTKILENTFRAVNIGLVNEVALIADRLGVDVWEVIDAAATKPFGFMKFTPGPRSGRTLHSGGSPLSVLENADAELQDPVHRRGLGNQLGHARIRGREGLGGAEPGREAGERGSKSWCWVSPTNRISTMCGSPRLLMSSAFWKGMGQRWSTTIHTFPAWKRTDRVWEGLELSRTNSSPPLMWR